MTLVGHFNDVSLSPGSLIERLLYHAEMHPDHDAIVSQTARLSYVQLAQLVRSQVNRFNDAGIKADAVIGIKCADDSQHLVLCLAAVYMGATSCTVPSYEPVENQETVVESCGVSYVADGTAFVNEPSSAELLEASPEVAAKASLLFSTSGTTGAPKLVVHYDSDIVAQAHRHIGSSHERFACLASMEHNFAKRHRLYCVAMGATNVFIDTIQNSLLAQCQALDVNVMHVSAFQAQELLAIPGVDALSNIQLKLGGSHVATTLRARLRNSITSNLRAGYGTTETGAIAFTDPDDAGSDNSVGRALPGIEVRTVSADGEILGRGETGELHIRCHGMFRGYSGNSDLTASRLEDGWFRSGDIGYLDEEGRIYLCGRSDDMFVFNSMNIFPQDIESQIRQFPGIVDTAVFPKRSSVHGNIPVALLVFAKNTRPQLQELEKFLKRHLGLRSPRQLLIVDEIPRNTAGKIARREVAKLSAQAEPIRKTIIRALDPKAKMSLKASQIAEFERGSGDILFRKVDLDSLGRMELLVALELEYDVVIHPNEYGNFRYLGNMVARVLSLQHTKEQEEQQKQESGQKSQDLQKTNIDSDFNDVIRDNPAVDAQPYIVRFFKRIVRLCPTVAHLNRALTSLEYRLSPADVDVLYAKNRDKELVPAGSGQKYHAATSRWLEDLQQQLLSSGKLKTEPFIYQRLAPTATLFIGTGTPAGKTLLICFPGRGDRSMMMPVAVLLQHVDAAAYDVLVIAEVLNQAYQRGVPFLGNTVTDMADWIANSPRLVNYGAYRTMGCSAGSYPALITAYRLRAEFALSIGGRFHKNKHIVKILERIFVIWRARLKGHCPQVLLSYAKNVGRDRQYARTIAFLFGAKPLVIERDNGQVGHLILEKLVENGGLRTFLTQTVFAQAGMEIIPNKNGDLVFSFPENKVLEHQ